MKYGFNPAHEKNIFNFLYANLVYQIGAVVVGFGDTLGLV